MSDFFRMLEQNASPIEWAYTLIALVTILISLKIYAKEREDLRYQEKEGRIRPESNRGELMVARYQTFARIISMGIRVVVFALGASAMVTPPGNPQTPISLTAIIFSVGFILINLGALAVDAVAYIVDARLDALDSQHKAWTGEERRIVEPVVSEAVVQAQEVQQS